MPKTLKQILDNVWGEIGFEIPDAYANSPDTDALQAFYVANKSVSQLREDGFAEQIRSTTLTMVSGQEAYTKPTDFLGLVPGTAFVVGDLRNIDLPASPIDWAIEEARASPGAPYYEMRFIGTTLNIVNPVDGAVLRYEYMSNAPITGAAYASLRVGTAGRSAGAQEEFITDSDVWDLDDTLIQMDIKWRWKKEKGLDWQPDLAEFKAYKNRLRSRNNGAKPLYGNPMPDVPYDPYTSLWAPY